MKNRPSSLTRIGIMIVVLGALFYCYEYFLRVSPAVMKPDLMSSFHLDATLFGALSAYYFYAYSPMQLVVGVLVDRYRVRYVLVLAVLACALGAFIFGNSHDYALAAFGRFLQGFGSAFAFVGALKLAAVWLPENRFALASGSVNFAGFVGAGLSEIFITKLTQWLGWRHSLTGLAFLGILLAILILLTLKIKTPKKTTPKHKMNTLRQSLKNLGKAIKRPYIWLAGLFACLMFLPTSVFAALWGIPYEEVLHHYSPTQAATAVSGIFIGWAIGSLITGFLADYLGKRALLMRVGSFFAFGLVVLLIYDAALSFWLVLSLFIVFGCFSSVECLSFVVAKDHTPSVHGVGSAIAFVNALTMLGGLIFQRGVGYIMDTQGHPHVVHGHLAYSLEQYQHALLIIPISLGLAFLVSLAIKDKKHLAK